MRSRVGGLTGAMAGVIGRVGELAEAMRGVKEVAAAWERQAVGEPDARGGCAGGLFLGPRATDAFGMAR